MADDVDGPGFYADMPTLRYLSDPAPEPSLDGTLARELIDTCPAAVRFMHPRLNPAFEEREATPAMVVGTVAHALLLGRGKELAVLPFDNWQSDKAKLARQEARKLGLVPVLQGKHQEIAAMVMEAKRQAALIDAQVFDSEYGHAELAVFAQDPVGIWTRALIDWYGDRLGKGPAVLDYKTVSGSANPEGLRAKMRDWAFQAAFQDRILTQLRPALAGKIRYCFFVQETDPPYLCSVVEPSSAAMLLGAKMTAVAIGWFHHCLAHDNWPGYSPVSRLVDPPVWAEQSWMEREFLPQVSAYLANDPILGRSWITAAPAVTDGHNGPEPVVKKNKGGRPRKSEAEKAAAKAQREEAKRVAREGAMVDLLPPAPPASTTRKLDL